MARAAEAFSNSELWSNEAAPMSLQKNLCVELSKKAEQMETYCQAKYVHGRGVLGMVPSQSVKAQQLAGTGSKQPENPKNVNFMREVEGWKICS